MPSETTITAIDDGHTDGNVDCWCCGATDLPQRMVELGNHAEVHLCLQCAHYVHQQAWQIEDEDKVGPGALVRDRFRNLRAQAIAKGWHHNRFIGGRLRWLGKFVP